MTGRRRLIEFNTQHVPDSIEVDGQLSVRRGRPPVYRIHTKQEIEHVGGEAIENNPKDV